MTRLESILREHFLRGGAPAEILSSVAGTTALAEGEFLKLKVFELLYGRALERSARTTDRTTIYDKDALCSLGYGDEMPDLSAHTGKTRHPSNAFFVQTSCDAIRQLACVGTTGVSVDGRF